MKQVNISQPMYRIAIPLLVVILFSHNPLWASGNNIIGTDAIVDDYPAGYDEPLMGAQAFNIDASIQSSVGTLDLNGVYLQSVPTGSYAEDQGFLADDVILSINDTIITDKQSFWLEYNIIEPGTSVGVTLWRNNAEIDASFVKMTAPEELNNTAGVVYTGNWSYQEKTNKAFFYSDIEHSKYADSYFEIEFYGTGISLTATLASNASTGIEISIDGVVNDTVSAYNGSEIYNQEFYSISGLTEAVHTIKVTNTIANKYLMFDSYTISFDPLATDVVFTDKDDTSFKLYPNPAAEFVMIKTDTEMLRVSTYDMNGKLILSQKASGTSLKLALPNVNESFLFVKVILEDGSELTKKVLR